MITSVIPLSPAIPKLRDGERLSRAEFERRYAAMPDVKAELLDGVVYMSSPVSAGHSTPHSDVMGWLYVYKVHTPGVETGDNGTVRLSDRSESQPDAHLRILESRGGQSHVDDDGYVSGSPELLAEVAKSSKDTDLNVKKPIYRREGIREFILWRVEDEAIDWFILRNGEYESLVLGPDGIRRSETFPGLWLDVAAMLRRDGKTVLKVLQQGIDSPEHAAFVERLAVHATSGNGR